MRKLNAMLLVAVVVALAVPASAASRRQDVDGPLLRSWNRFVHLFEGPMIPPPPPKGQAEPQSPPPGQGR
jgi:hypothetical protein